MVPQLDIDPTWRDNLTDAQMRLEESLSRALLGLRKEGVPYVFIIRWTYSKGDKFHCNGRIFLPEQEKTAQAFAHQLGGLIEKLTFKEDLCPTAGTRTSKGFSLPDTCTSAGTMGATLEADPSPKKGSSAPAASNALTNETYICDNTLICDARVRADQLDACVEQHLRHQKWFQELQASRKENWVPSSRGGYPDYYGG